MYLHPKILSGEFVVDSADGLGYLRPVQHPLGNEMAASPVAQSPKPWVCEGGHPYRRRPIEWAGGVDDALHAADGRSGRAQRSALRCIPHWA